MAIEDFKISIKFMHSSKSQSIFKPLKTPAIQNQLNFFSMKSTEPSTGLYFESSIFINKEKQESKSQETKSTRNKVGRPKGKTTNLVMQSSIPLEARKSKKQLKKEKKILKKEEKNKKTNQKEIKNTVEVNAIFSSSCMINEPKPQQYSAVNTSSALQSPLQFQIKVHPGFKCQLSLTRCLKTLFSQIGLNTKDPILDKIRKQGYFTSDQSSQFQFNTSEMVLKQLKFHQQQHFTFENYYKPIYQDNFCQAREDLKYFRIQSYLFDKSSESENDNQSLNQQPYESSTNKIIDVQQIKLTKEESSTINLSYLLQNKQLFPEQKPSQIFQMEKQFFPSQIQKERQNRYSLLEQFSFDEFLDLCFCPSQKTIIDKFHGINQKSMDICSKQKLHQNEVNQNLIKSFDIQNLEKKVIFFLDVLQPADFRALFKLSTYLKNIEPFIKNYLRKKIIQQLKDNFPQIYKEKEQQLTALSAKVKKSKRRTSTDEFVANFKQYQNKHICLRCLKYFETGVQLGGHISQKHPGSSEYYKQRIAYKQLRMVQNSRKQYFKCLRKVQQLKEILTT